MFRSLLVLPLLAVVGGLATADDYAAVAAKRAQAAVAAAKLDAPAKVARVEKLVAGHYVELHAIHDTRDAGVKAAAGDPDKVRAAHAPAEAAVKTINDTFLAALTAELTPEQAEVVIDKMTYNVTPITFKGYCDMLPDLTAEQKAKVLEFLKAGRAKALVAGDAKEKHEEFGKAKGKINNYLSGQGYDLKAASQAWAERRKAAAQSK